MAAKRFRTACDLSPMLATTRKQGRESKAFVAVGLQVARHALRAKKEFYSDQIKLRKLPKDFSPQIIRIWREEWLGSLDNLGPGSAQGVHMLAALCPNAVQAVKTKWRGRR